MDEKPLRLVRVLGYARVSTDAQNLDLQTDALEKAGCSRIYQDHASGAKASRPDLDRLLATVQPGDTVVVWKLDRLGRSNAHVAQLLKDFRDRDINVRSLTEGMDTSTTMGRAMLGMAAVFAEMERDFIRERTHAGLAAARARGRRGGRKPIMTAKRIRLAQEMYEAKETAAVIAKTLGVSERTVWRHLGRPAPLVVRLRPDEMGA